MVGHLFGGLEQRKELIVQHFISYHDFPKGLRHGYGVWGISAGVPLNMLSK
jgi:hypothetical protein